jgi:hypothetical protein
MIAEPIVRLVLVADRQGVYCTSLKFWPTRFCLIWKNSFVQDLRWWVTADGQPIKLKIACHAKEQPSYSRFTDQTCPPHQNEDPTEGCLLADLASQLSDEELLDRIRDLDEEISPMLAAKRSRIELCMIDVSATIGPWD